MRILEDFYTSNLTEEEKALLMLQDGISALEIEKYLSINQYKINKLRADLPALPQTFKKFVTTETKANCLICDKPVNKEDMPKRIVNNQKLYIMSYCNECQNVGDPQPLFPGSIPKRLARKEKTTRADNKITIKEIPYGYFAFLYNKQQGKCFYSGATLNFNLRVDLKDTLSIDRVIFDGGYQQGNIVMAANKINAMKSDMTLEEMEKWSPKLFEKVNYFLQNKPEFMMETK